jgi:hypothetical protein
MNTITPQKRYTVIIRSKDDPKNLESVEIGQGQMADINRAIANKTPCYVGSSLVAISRIVDIEEAVEQRTLLTSTAGHEIKKGDSGGCPKCDRGWIDGPKGSYPCSCANNATQDAYKAVKLGGGYNTYSAHKKPVEAPYIAVQGHPNFWQDVLKLNQACQARGQRWLKNQEIIDFLSGNAMSAKEVFIGIHSKGK